MTLANRDEPIRGGEMHGTHPTDYYYKSKSKLHRKSTELNFAEIERFRAAHTIDVGELCRHANLNSKTYYDARSGEHRPQRGTLIRLTRALQYLIKHPPAERRVLMIAAPEIINGLYRAAVVIMAGEIGADARLALEAPRAVSNLDPANAAAGKARRLAFYLTANAFNVKRRNVQDAVGYSKQAASKALKEIEDQRGTDAALDRTINRVAQLLTGSELL